MTKSRQKLIKLVAPLLILFGLLGVMQTLSSCSGSDQGKSTLRLVLRVQTEELDNREIEAAVARTIEIIRERLDNFGFSRVVIQQLDADRISIDLPVSENVDLDDIVELITKLAVLEFKFPENSENANVILQKIDSVVYAHEHPQVVENQTSKEVLADPLVVTIDYGLEEDLDVLDDTHPFTSRLEWTLVAGGKMGQEQTAWPGFAVSKNDRQLLESWLDLPEVKNLIPEDIQFAWSARVDKYKERKVWNLYMLKRQVRFVGKYMEDFELAQGQFGGYEVRFRLSSEGTDRFAQLTGDNVGKPLAMVMDGCVESAPIIRSKIRGSCSITMGREATREEAMNMMIVLGTGALPAPLEILERSLLEPKQ